MLQVFRVLEMEWGCPESWLPVWKKAIQSLRPAGFTSACGSVVGSFGAAGFGTAEAVPLRGWRLAWG